MEGAEDRGSDRVVFLSVPGSLGGLSLGGAGFAVDPDVPLPMEVPEEGLDAAKVALENLSWESVVSGMLRVLAQGEVRGDWLDYYRGFVLALRPAIMGELSEAAAVKSHSGDHALALEILDALRGLFPLSPGVRLDRALALESRAALLDRRGSPDADAVFRDAEAAFAEATSLAPPLPEAFFRLGLFRLARRDFAGARESLARFLELDEEDAIPDEGDGDPRRRRALAAIREIDAGGLEDEVFGEAYRLVRDGSAEAGMLRVRDFIERRPEVWNGWFVLGWALRGLGRWDDAAAAFGKALELGGSGGDVRNELAICLMETGDIKGARLQLEAALRADCENVKVISNLGVLALKSGRREEAAAFLRTALDIDPEDALAQELLASIDNPKAGI